MILNFFLFLQGNGNGNGQKRGTNRSDGTPWKLLKTRPETNNSKAGTSGTQVKLSANYFKMLRKPTFEFTQYHVDFEPVVDLDQVRKAFIGQQREYLGGYLYDGANQMYLTHRLPQDLVEFQITSREGKEYTLKIKYTGKIEMTEGAVMQVLNLILRRTMDGLNMQLVGRNMYDAGNKVKLDSFRIELWPGYITSIRQHEQDILVCAEVSHKVMRQETIYEILRNCRQDDQTNWQDNFKREIIGSVVLTDYNNHTYRVDDVDFSASPLSTFKQRGVDVTYKDYYQAKYNIVIRDQRQPMLVSNPKARDIRAGRTQVIFLVPELCRATGLTDKMRANFQMMKAMAEHTQMDPERRKARLLNFTKRIYDTPTSMQHLNNFNTDIDRNLVQFPGRALRQETIQFGAGASVTNDDRVDWTNPMKMNQMFHTIPLKRWAFLYPKRCAKESEEFLNLMRDVANGMHYDMADPKSIELPDDRTATYVTHMEQVMSKDPKLIMIVVPNNAADRYAAIKRLTCVNRAIPTQVIVSKTMQPKVRILVLFIRF